MTLSEAIEKRGCHCGSITAIHARWCPLRIAADLRSGALGEDEEPDPPVIYHVKGDERELWAVVAHKAGNWTPLTPKHFPACGTYDEVIERAAIKLGQDPAFRARWKGHHLAGCRVDRQVTA